MFISCAERKKLWKKLSQIENDYKISYQKLIENDWFHSLQAYGTCSESNKTAPEVAMCDKKTRRQLKLFTLEKLVSDVANTSFRNRRAKTHVLELGYKRLSQLRAKVQKQAA